MKPTLIRPLTRKDELADKTVFYVPGHIRQNQAMCTYGYVLLQLQTNHITFFRQWCYSNQILRRRYCTEVQKYTVFPFKVLYLSRVMRKQTMCFPNRFDTNRAVQAQMMARGWNFGLGKKRYCINCVAKIYCEGADQLRSYC